MLRAGRWAAEEGDAYVVSLVRRILGFLLFLSALREAHGLFAGYYFGDVFHLPFVPEALVPSRVLFASLVAIEIGLAVLVTLGWAARTALLFSSLIGIYLLLCDRLAYHNNRYALLLFSFLLVFAPCDRAFVWSWRKSKSRPSPGERVGPLWAARLMQVELAIIYLASGGSKLADPDWRGGQVIGDRLLRSVPVAVAKGVPLSLMEALADPSVSSALSKVAIATELFLAVGLFVPRTRFFALWWGVMFHLTIELTSSVELFGWLSLTIYALFASPQTRERALVYDPAFRPAARLASLVRRLDWLARFELRPESMVGNRWAVLDRDGSVSTGLSGVARIARATPILFPLSLPLLVLARFSHRDTRIAAC